MKYKLSLIILLIAFAASGCAYNSRYIHNNQTLSDTQVNKLNNIMFAYLDIPILKTSPAKKTARSGTEFYYDPYGKTDSVMPKVKRRPAKTSEGKNAGKNEVFAVHKPKLPIMPYVLTIKGNSAYLKINTKNKILLFKTFYIRKVKLTIAGFACKKGYEIAQISLLNNGAAHVISENFRYSNAGVSFKLDKYENIKNLTVANKYEKGITLRLTVN